MSKDKHTPGPWRRGDYHTNQIFAIDGNIPKTICTVESGGKMSHDEYKANCELIVEAPKLKKWNAELLEENEDLNEEAAGLKSINNNLKAENEKLRSQIKKMMASWEHGIKDANAILAEQFSGAGLHSWERAEIVERFNAALTYKPDEKNDG